jgi:hypothetical protein
MSDRIASILTELTEVVVSKEADDMEDGAVHLAVLWSRSLTPEGSLVRASFCIGSCRGALRLTR